VAYAALNVFLTLDSVDGIGKHTYALTDKDGAFLESFDAERNKRVEEKVRDATETAKTLEPGRVIGWSGDPWTVHDVTCPVCDNTAMLFGYTEPGSDQLNDGEVVHFLTFWAESFMCDECGLVLEDMDELELVGLEVAHDMTDLMGEWLHEFAEEE
jgi:hypothetical protein